jgi:hypothetical protein
MNIRQVSHLYAFEDGDTITPRMGIIIDAGCGLQQYWDPMANKVIETDFTKHPATLYPQAYSSRLAAIIVPDSTGAGWYYNNPNSAAALISFDDNGKSSGTFSGLFEKTEVNVNGKNYPGLKIVGNLANAADYTDKYIYYVATYKGKQFTCQQLIPIQASAGSQLKILLSVEGQDGTGDNVLSNDNDWIKYTAYLQMAGVTVNNSSFKFYRLVGGNWSEVSSQSGLYEIATTDNSASLKLYNAAVEGVELYKVVATLDGKEYTETFEATDIHDPFYIVDGCSIAGEAVKVGETVTFNPQIYDRSTGELATGNYVTSKWTFNFTFISRTTGQPITSLTKDNLTYDNIQSTGGIATVIEASI